MSEWEIQKILFWFSGLFILIAGGMIYLGHPGYATCVLGFSVLLIGVAGVRPSTIKTFGAGWGKGEGHFGIARYLPTENVRELVEDFSQDKPSPEIEEEGKKFIEQAEERPPEKRSTEDYLALAADKWRAKDYDAALQNVYAGLALEPEDIRIQATLVHRKANNFASLGSKEHAEKCFNEAINIDPSFSWPLNNLGLLYGGQGMYEKAEAEFRKAIALDPDNEKSPFNIGLLYEKQGKFELAKVQFERTLKINPDYEKAKSGLERVEKKLKE